MIFAFIENGTLAIHADVAEIQREYAAIDVESGVIRFYDVDGTYLAPVFTIPNRIQRHFIFFKTIVSGEYNLQPSSEKREDPIWLCLVETSYLEPNSYFASLADVKAHFIDHFPSLNKNE